jgi:hypothetical protein
VHELLACKLAGIRIEERELLYEKIHGKISLDSLRPSYLIFSSGFKKTRLVLSMKRLSDIFFALLGLTITLPITIVTAIAIKLDSRGPVCCGSDAWGSMGTSSRASSSAACAWTPRSILVPSGP